MTTDEILLEVRGAAAVATLNRPRALNALTLDMIHAFYPRLGQWAADREIGAVVVQGAGERAFCAGGDIRALYDGGPGSRITAQFFRDEYRLNHRIFHFPKPYVALMDGITMGGGVGLSVHGSHRIVTEATVFAMPETGIGLFPDVGGSYFLPRLPGEVGMYLALTGSRLKAADCLYAGIADAFVPAARLDELVAALAAGETVEAVLERVAEDPGPAPLSDLREAIDRCFAGESVEAIEAALEEEGSAWARETLAQMAGKSPTSQKIAFRQLRTGRRLGFDDCMIMEYRLSQRVMAGHDFFEGVRAAVVDKDQTPRWRPASLAEVSDEDIEAYFAPLGERDLSFPEGGTMIAFPKRAEWDGERSEVRFPAAILDRTVICRIPANVLRKRFAAAEGGVGALAAFHENRAAIEARVKSKLLSGSYQADGSILLSLQDF